MWIAVLLFAALLSTVGATPMMRGGRLMPVVPNGTVAWNITLPLAPPSQNSSKPVLSYPILSSRYAPNGLKLTQTFVMCALRGANTTFSVTGVNLGTSPPTIAFSAGIAWDSFSPIDGSTTAIVQTPLGTLAQMDYATGVIDYSDSQKRLNNHSGSGVINFDGVVWTIRVNAPTANATVNTILAYYFQPNFGPYSIPSTYGLGLYGAVNTELIAVTWKDNKPFGTAMLQMYWNYRGSLTWSYEWGTGWEHLAMWVDHNSGQVIVAGSGGMAAVGTGNGLPQYPQQAWKNGSTLTATPVKVGQVVITSLATRTATTTVRNNNNSVKQQNTTTTTVVVQAWNWYTGVLQWTIPDGDRIGTPLGGSNNPGWVYTYNGSYTHVLNVTTGAVLLAAVGRWNGEFGVWNEIVTSTYDTDTDEVTVYGVSGPAVPP